MQPLHPPERPLDPVRAAPSPARVLEGWFARGGRPASDDTTMSVPLVAQAWSRYLAQAEHVGAIALDATSMPLDRIELFEAALAFVRAVAEADPATAPVMPGAVLEPDAVTLAVAAVVDPAALVPAASPASPPTRGPATARWASSSCHRTARAPTVPTSPSG